MPNKDGHSKASSVQSLHKTIDTMPDQFKEQALIDLKDYETAMSYNPPLMFQQAYKVFWSVRKNFPPRTPIPFSELKAYRDLYNLTLEPFEIDLIKSIDYIYVTAFNKEQ